MGTAVPTAAPTTEAPTAAPTTATPTVAGTTEVSGDPAAFTAAQSLAILNKHNQYRAMEPAVPGTMNVLQWDDNLAASAQLAANDCNFAHTQGRQVEGFSSVGENIYVTASTGEPSFEAVVPVVNWWEEISDYNYD